MSRLNRLNTLLQIYVIIIVGLSTTELIADEQQQLESFKSAYSEYQELADAGDYEQALPAARTSYEIGSELFGNSNTNTAALAYNYGLTLLEVGDIDEAKSILRKAVKHYEKAYGSDSVELIPVLVDLAKATAEYQDSRYMKKHYDRALMLTKQHYGEDSIVYGNLSLEAGMNMLNLTETPASERYLITAHEIFQNELGEDHDATGLAAFQLARFEVASRNYDDAKIHLLAALNTFEDPERPTSSIEVSTHAWLVAVYEELGEADKATEHCLAIGRMTPYEPDQEYLPIYRKAPNYPTAAQMQGSEGYVDLEFTVDEQGIVHNPRVISSKGNKLFIDRSIEAVLGFRYAPRFEDGNPVSTPNVRTRFTYVFAD